MKIELYKCYTKASEGCAKFHMAIFGPYIVPVDNSLKGNQRTTIILEK